MPSVAQLTMLSGRTVVFHTGLALLDAASGDCQTAMVDVRSTFRELAPAEIEALPAPRPALRLRRLGQIRGARHRAVQRIDSDDPTALVGLPLIRLTDMLRAAGVDLRAGVPDGPSSAVHPAPTCRAASILVPNLLGVVAPETCCPRARSRSPAASRITSSRTQSRRAQFLKTLGDRDAAAADRHRRDRRGLRRSAAPNCWRPARDGNDLGLLSDAGCPGVADPGALLVAAAHREGIAVVPLVGPSAILLALMASGMNGQGFTFHGYLPVKPAARSEAIRAWRPHRSRRLGAAFIETPYRNPR